MSDGAGRGEQDPGEERPEVGGAEDSVYDAYVRGMELLEAGDYQAATIPLGRAAKEEPEKASAREALGRALYRIRRYEEAAEEFAAVVELDPVNDYAHFVLGRALTKMGELERAQRHLALAANLRPERKDYRKHLEQIAES